MVQGVMPLDGREVIVEEACVVVEFVVELLLFGVVVCCFVLG